MSEISMLIIDLAKYSFQVCGSMFRRFDHALVERASL